MTELLASAVQVRSVRDGEPVAVHLDGRWHTVERVTARWIVDGDWWRLRPHRRAYHRCLVGEAECVELSHDLVAGTWQISRRYD